MAIILLSFFIVVFSYLLFKNSQKKKAELIQNEIDRKNEQRKDSEKRTLEKNKLINKLDSIIKSLSKIEDLEIPKPTVFKTFIIENEIKIKELGGEVKILEFIKIDKFLNDFRNDIVIETEEIIKTFDFKKDSGSINKHYNNFVRSRIMFSEIDVDKLNAELILSSLIKKIDFYHKYRNDFVRVIKEEILLYNYYNSIAFAMVLYFLEDKKIDFYDIYQAFEGLGVYDSTWQKKIVYKLDTIDKKLDRIDKGVTMMNDNFVELSKKSEMLHEDLKISLSNLNSSIGLNNVLSGIQAYQLYKININTKSLREKK